MRAMSREELGLWERLCDFNIDGDASVVLDFQARLAKENGWTHVFAARAIEEYKRFLFLCGTADHIVTPSEEVDQVWHLHLVYTQSYWHRLCGEVLGKPIHHNPTTGGLNEGSKFEDCYQKTLQSYRRYFGEAPPFDLWPPREKRFAPADQKWIDVSRNWVIRKPKLLSRRWAKPVLTTSLIALGAATLTGCFSTLEWHGENFLALFIALMAATLLLSSIISRTLRPFGHARTTDRLEDPYDIAFLAGGGARALHSVLGKLYGARLIDVTGSKKDGFKIRKAQEEPPTPPNLDEFARQVLSTMPTGAHRPFKDIANSLSPVLDRKREELSSKGLLMTHSSRSTVQWMTAAPVIALVGLGVAKITIGTNYGDPVWFIVLLVAISTAMIVPLVTLVSHRTKAGDQVWNSIKTERSQNLRNLVKAEPADDAPSVLIPMAIAVLDPSVLAHADGYEELNQSLQDSNASSRQSGGCGAGCGNTSCGGGSGCGGGGCGGGCGGG